MDRKPEDPMDPVLDQLTADELPHHQQTESFGLGHIRSRHGRLDRWLLVVYALVFAWALWYGYKFWGGLGPGLDLTL
jgi:hypothetical protein